jgi:hypothetical protein
MRPIQPLVRLPHSHIDPNWLSAVELESKIQPREFYERAAGHVFSASGSVTGSLRLVFIGPLYFMWMYNRLSVEVFVT